MSLPVSFSLAVMRFWFRANVAESGDQVGVCLDLLSGGLAAEPGEGNRVGLHLDRQEVNAQGLADQPPLSGDEAVKVVEGLWGKLAAGI